MSIGSRGWGSEKEISKEENWNYASWPNNCTEGSNFAGGRRGGGGGERRGILSQLGAVRLSFVNFK